jgi:hypothetical protein
MLANVENPFSKPGITLSQPVTARESQMCFLGGQMNHLLRLIVLGGLIAFAVLYAPFLLARNHVEILTPLRFSFFLVSVSFYLLPTGLAIYRKCRSTLWIAAVNVLLGWTLFGWFVAIGWAASGAAEPLIPEMTVHHPQTNPRD